MELIAEVQGEGQIFYRRRRRRVKRKSGNIDDFCRRWGNQYSYMVVLDADSVMSGDCLSGLVRLMKLTRTRVSFSLRQKRPAWTRFTRVASSLPPVFTGRCLLPVCTSGSWVSPTTGSQRHYPREAVC